MIYWMAGDKLDNNELKIIFHETYFLKFNLYDYCRKEVISNYRNNLTEGIDSSIQVFDDILDGWRQIG